MNNWIEWHGGEMPKGIEHHYIRVRLANGDEFYDMHEILKKMLQKKPVKQVYQLFTFTNYEYKLTSFSFMR
jgi:hypothetical protein